MLRYRAIVAIPATTSVGDLVAIRDRVRERGSSDWSGLLDRLTIDVEADDLWDMREVLEDIRDELLSYGIDWTFDRSKIEGDQKDAVPEA
jgi:hypothetical protein